MSEEEEEKIKIRETNIETSIKINKNNNLAIIG
jgi:hypothetical protein